MRRWWFVFLFVLILCGCKAEKELETISDVHQTPKTVHPMEVCVSVPDDAALEVMSSPENGSIYFCEDYTLTMHTVPAGDLRKTVLEASGFLPDQLPIIKTQKAGCVSYDFVWTSVGEQGDQVCRCSILDDGNFHYVLTAMADAEVAGQLTEKQWEDVFSTFCLAKPDADQY